MSSRGSVDTDPSKSTTHGGLTDDERELFERLHDKFKGEDIGRVFEIALQSSSDTDNEEASS
ncbi:kinesin [Haloferax sp. CBA1148]|nr:kinesin [Haloferax sp. CBA1148]